MAAALILGLSPALLASARQILAQPGLVYVVGVWLLLGHLVASDPSAEEPRLHRAIPWVLVAVAIQILAWAAGVPRYPRFAVPFALTGFLRGVCGTRFPTAGLAFLCIPPPSQLTRVIGADFANLWAQLASGVAPPYSGAWSAWDGGLRLATLATAVVAYRWLRARQLESRPGAGHTLLAIVCVWGIAVGLQIAAFVLAGFAPSGIEEFVFVHGSWLLVFVAVLFVPLPGFPPLGWRTQAIRDAH